MFFCREELAKEEMYVEYLDKLLADIELHRNKKNGSVDDTDEEDEDVQDDLDLTVTSAATKKKIQDDQLDVIKQASLRSSLHLDLGHDPKENGSSKRSSLKENGSTKGSLKENGGKGSEIEDHSQNLSSFVTVINVTSAEKAAQNKSSHDLNQDQLQPGSKFTFTKSKPSKKTESSGQTVNSFGKKTQLSNNPYSRQDSRESLNSISSPLSPTSPSLSLSENPLLSPREAPASPREHALIVGGENDDTSPDNSSPSNTKSKPKPEPPARSISIKDIAKSSSSAEDIDLTSSTDIELNTAARGRPDGGETDESLSSSLAASLSDTSQTQFNKVKDLRANWEKKPPISVKPVAVERRSKLERSLTSPPVPRRSISKTRNDSDSSRGRMGSPSGKSHDSSDSGIQ